MTNPLLRADVATFVGVKPTNIECVLQSQNNCQRQMLSTGHHCPVNLCRVPPSQKLLDIVAFINPWRSTTCILLLLHVVFPVPLESHLKNGSTKTSNQIS